MAETIFLTEIDKSVQAVLDARKSYHSKINYKSLKDSGESIYNWLVKKMAYAECQATNENTNINVKRATLSIPRTSGFKADGMYRPQQKQNLKSGDNSSYLPKPVLNSVKVSNTGDFGSIRKCEISFTVFSLNDLNLMQPFFDMGADIKVNYGWSVPSNAAGKEGRFQGKVYNFSYQLNNLGGFDCVSHSMGSGINIVGGNITAPKDSKGETYEDAIGNQRYATSIISKIKRDVKESVWCVNDVNLDVGIGQIQYPTTWTQDSASEQGTKYYVSLERIVALINDLLVEAGGEKFKKLRLRCDSEVTRGVMPTDTNILCSANPKECLFPGYCAYNIGSVNSIVPLSYSAPKQDFMFGAYDSEFLKGDLSKTMLSVEYLDAIFIEMGKEMVKQQKSQNLTISEFLKKLFHNIYLNSGERFQLSLVSNPKQQNEIWVVDINYVPKDRSKKIYEITAITQDSICRSVSMQSKVPNESAVTAFIANTSALTGQRGDVISNVVGQAGTKPSNTQKFKDQLGYAKSAVHETGLTDTNVNELRSALKQARISNTEKSTTGVEALPFPIDLSFTLDGVSGIYFGNTVTCNYLPDAYKKANPRIAFTITQVEDIIQNNDWITNLQTVCRTVYE